MPYTRLGDMPVLSELMERLVTWMYPDCDHPGGRLSEYIVEDATAGYSSTTWQEREFSGTVFVRLSKPKGTTPVAPLPHGCYANTNHGMFVVAIGGDGLISDIEMHFYTRLAPPFLGEILALKEFDINDERRQEILEDASSTGFFDVDEFFQSIADRPIRTVEMDE